MRGGRPPSAGARRRDAAQLRGDWRALAAHRHHAGAGGGARRAARRRRARSASACATGGRSSRTRSATSPRRASTRVIGIPLAPQFSTLSVAEVRRRRATRRRLPRAGGLQFDPVRSFHAHPLLLEAFAERLRAAAPSADELVVFTAHSLPVRVIEAGDPYATKWPRRRAASPTRRGVEPLRRRLSERRPHARAVDRSGARRR